MENKIAVILAIIAIVFGVISLSISAYLWIKDIPEEIQESESYDIEQSVCYMPRDCFDTQKDYLDQFPEKEEPRYFPECLVYCYK